MQLLRPCLFQCQDFAGVTYVPALEALGEGAIFIRILKKVAFTAPGTTLKVIHCPYLRFLCQNPMTYSSVVPVFTWTEETAAGLTSRLNSVSKPQPPAIIAPSNNPMTSIKSISRSGLVECPH